jgi:Subtilase family
MVLIWQQKWGFAFCAVVLALVAITEFGEEDEFSVDDTMRMEERLKYNQLFEVDVACDTACIQHVISRLEYSLGCSTLQYLPHTHMIEGNCNRIHSLTPYQIGELAQAGLSAIQEHYNNEMVLLPPDEGARSLGPNDDLPIGDRWLTRARRIKGNEDDIGAVARAEQSVTYANWGLDRIDQKQGWSPSAGGLDGIFNDHCFPKQGRGATVYVVDTGCEANHEDLAGRTMVLSRRYSSGNDDNGHGTHVAGIAAGTKSGVCKQCQVVCVKALNRAGAGSSGDIVDAIEFVLQEHAHQPANTPAVVVLSIGGVGDSTVFDRAVERLSKEGIVPVVAASNYHTDACLYSPARSEYAITVGASTLVDMLFDKSNGGKCVNIIAPGHGITSASHKSISACKFFFVLPA